MFVSSRSYKEEVSVVLQLGVDFTEDDIDDRYALKSVHNEALIRAANNNGYLNWTWVGHYDENTHTVECKFTKPIYIDEQSNQVVIR